jgi:hypothetical protein
MPGHSNLPCADCVNLSAMPGIHVLLHVSKKTWMAGTMPGHDEKRVVRESLKMPETFSAGSLCRLGKLPVRIDDEFAGDAGVEVLVAFRRLVEADHLDIDDLGDRQPVPEYRLHQLTVVF